MTGTRRAWPPDARVNADEVVGRSASWVSHTRRLARAAGDWTFARPSHYPQSGRRPTSSRERDGTLHRSAAATPPAYRGRLLRFDRRFRGGDAPAPRAGGEVPRLRDRLHRRRADP